MEIDARSGEQGGGARASSVGMVGGVSGGFAAAVALRGGRARVLGLVAFLAIGASSGVAWACLNDTAVARREAQFRSSYAVAAVPAAEQHDRVAWAVVLVAATGLAATLLADRELAMGRAARQPSPRSLLRQRLARRHALAIACAVVAPPLVAVGGVPRAWLRWGERVPALHHVAPVAGGTSLRFAMLHDILTDRYERPSRAWHEARLAKRLATIEAAERRGAQREPAALDAMDDAAVSLDQLRRPAEGEALMRRKLALLGVREPEPSAAGPVMRDLFGVDPDVRSARMATPLTERDRPRYQAAANLATVLAHQALADVWRCEPTAARTAAEARSWLLDAIAIHPGAHFGREMWQLAALDWIRTAACQPALLRRYDLLGDALARPVSPLAPDILEHAELACLRQLDASAIDEGRLSDAQRRCLRGGIVAAGAEDGFQRVMSAASDATDTLPRAFATLPIDFDEPALGLLGMWVFGGGPNPHSALAIAQLAEHAGEPYLAVEGYLRARELAERFHPDPEAQAWLRSYADDRVAQLTRVLEAIEPGLTVAELRRRFDAERAAGRRFQAERDADETARLAAGADVDDPALAVALAKAHGPIATPPGPEEWMTLERDGGGFVLTLACVATSLGGPMLLAALEWLRGFRARRARSGTPEPVTYRA